MFGSGTVQQILAEALAPVMRNLQDLQFDLLGSETQLLRIHTSTEMDIYGQRDEYVITSGLIGNCHIQYPLGLVQLYDTNSNTTSEVNTIDISEILPIVCYVKFAGSNTEEVLNLERDDIIVDVLQGANGEKIPIKLKVNNRAYGQFLSKYLVNRKFELTLLRGELPDAVQTIIDTYVASL